jgi:hypothetical protein
MGRVLRNSIVWILAALVLAACSGQDAPPDGTEWLEGGEEHWNGWIELVPAIRTPQFADGRDHTRVYLRLPRGAALTLADPRDPASIVVPEGAELDRVERHAWLDAHGVRVERVVDVRGTRFHDGGEELHVFRPVSAEDLRLFGMRWERVGHAPDPVLATMRSAMRNGHGLTGTSPARRGAAIARFSSLLACEGCHTPRTPPRLDGLDTWPRRPTDGSGLYSLLATLSDRSVLETYRPRNDHAADPFVETSCAAGSESCATREARLAVAHALEAGDGHARAVCDSRRALAARSDATLLRAYRDELAECGVSR